MTRIKITAGRYTVTTNANEANDETYQNWRTFNVKRYAKGSYNVSVLSNNDGNGQRWDAIGTIIDNRFMVAELSSYSTPFSHDALLLTCVSLLCDDRAVEHNCKVLGSFPLARIWKVKRNAKATAAPTLLAHERNGTVRNRNTNQMRLKVGGGLGGHNPLLAAKDETQMTRTVTFEHAFFPGNTFKVNQRWNGVKWIAVMS